MDINKEYISFAIELKEKSIFLNISFIDFVIIKDNSFISFKDKGII